MWWGQLKKVKYIDEKRISWNICSIDIFLRTNMKKNMQDFFDLKFGNISMEEYEKKKLEFRRYVSFIKEEKVNI